MLDRLDELWLPSFRQRLQQDEGRTRLEEDLRAKVGDALFESLRTLGATLAAHEHGDMALAFLRELVREQRPRRRNNFV